MCFSIIISRHNKIKIGYRVQVYFTISLHKKDKVLLQQIKEFLAVGSITEQWSKSIQFQVKSIKDLKVIIDFFDKFPLKTKKTGRFYFI